MSLVSGATRISGAGRLAEHLLRGLLDELTADQVAPSRSRGLVSEGLAPQLAELSAGANRSRTDRPLWHVHCNPEFENSRAITLFYQRLEEEFALQDARYTGVMHAKGNRGRHEHRVYDATAADGRVTDFSYERMRRAKIAALVAFELSLPLPPTPFRRPIAAALRRDGKLEAAAWVEAQPDRPSRHRRDGVEARGRCGPVPAPRIPVRSVDVARGRHRRDRAQVASRHGVRRGSDRSRATAPARPGQDGSEAGAPT